MDTDATQPPQGISSASAIRIALVEDHVILRAGLRVLLDGQPDMTVLGEAGNAPETLQLVCGRALDVVILDLTLQGTDALALIADIRRASPRTQVLILTMHDHAGLVRSALAAGAAGYMVKTTPHTELLAAIRAVHAGATIVDASLGVGPVKGGASRRAAGHRGGQLLSERERQVLQLLALGHTHQAIADRLGVGIKSVESYRARLVRKLDLTSRADLVRYALAIGLLRTDRPPEPSPTRLP